MHRERTSCPLRSIGGSRCRFSDWIQCSRSLAGWKSGVCQKIRTQESRVRIQKKWQRIVFTVNFNEHIQNVCLSSRLAENSPLPTIKACAEHLLNLYGMWWVQCVWRVLSCKHTVCSLPTSWVMHPISVRECCHRWTIKLLYSLFFSRLWIYTWVILIWQLSFFLCSFRQPILSDCIWEPYRMKNKSPVYTTFPDHTEPAWEKWDYDNQNQGYLDGYLSDFETN